MLSATVGATEFSFLLGLFFVGGGEKSSSLPMTGFD